MKIVSINVSPPVEVIHENNKIMTGIFKKPVDGPVHVSKDNLDGDGQADLKNHGGRYKAVYAYSYDHYTYWSDVLDRDDIEYGQFGENLTVTGLDETKLCIGDQLETGEVKFVITQPRVPCFKLGIRFGDSQMPKKFLKSALTGCYLRVLQEGHILAGDDLRVIHCDKNKVSIKSLFESYYISKEKVAREVLRNSLQVTELSPSWRIQIEKRLSGK